MAHDKGKIQIMDLDHAESDDDDFDEGLGEMEQEAKFLQLLQNEYGHCQVCGPTKVCKITMSGGHHPLSNNQQRAWAQSLVCNLVWTDSGIRLIQFPGSRKARCYAQDPSS